MRFTGFLLSVLACAIAACVPVPGGSTPAVTPAAPTVTTSELAPTSWRLVSFGSPGAERPVLPGSHITLEFGADGRAGGDGGCNSYGGSFTVQGDMLSFGEIVSTLMACADQAVTDQEGRYLAALGTAGRFSIDDDTLTIHYDTGNGVLTFVRA